MRWSEKSAHIIVVFRLLITIAYHKANGCASAFAFEHTAKQLHFIGLITTRGELALTWPTPIKLRLDEVYIYIDARRHTIYHASDGWPMAFAKGGEGEKISKCVAHNRYVG